MNIEKRIIDKVNPTYFIADIAANHDGDLSRAIDLIYMAAEAGADAAKFQHFQAETIVSNRGFESLGEQMSHQAKWKRSVYEVYKDASVNLDWTETLVAACKKAGITFFTTPYSLEVVDYLDDYVPAYKIGSGDISWPEMIKKVASKNKPYFIATGASRLDEVVAALSFAEPMNNNLCIMQCNTNYTASLENFKYINLNVLKIYEQLFPEICLGLSDHSPGHATVLGAVTLGARAIEKHFTDSNERTGPDHAFSMDPKSWKEMVLRTRELEFSLGTGVKQVEENEKDTVILQRRAMRATRSIRKGEIIKKSDFYPLRPCPEDAAHLMNLSDLEGFRVSRDFANGDYIKYGDIYKPYD